MKKTMWIIALVALSGSALLAQDITGTWQGALPAPPQAKGGRELRAVFKISNDAKGGLSAVMYSIDQGGQGIPVPQVTLQGSTVKMSMPAINGSYEGKLSADGNSMQGTWTQGPGNLALTLTRATAETAWAIPEPPPPPKPMAADADPEFEVATIKPSDPNRPGKAYTVRGRQVLTINTTLSDLITFAYGIHARQIADGPSWMETDKYDVTGQPDAEGLPNQTQLRSMLQKLLAERFKLSFHRDKRELSVYVITVADGGPKLTKSESTLSLPSLFFQGLGTLPARNATMADLAGLMQGAVLDRPVVDQTGISGRYDFTLKWTPDEFQFANLGGPRPAQPNQPDAPRICSPPCGISWG